MRTRWIAPALVALCAAAAAFVFAAGSAVGDSPPGWEPEAGTLGTIAFYDANGHAATGGDLSAHPATFYAAASGPGRAGDTKAQLKMFTPQVGVLPPLWSGDTLTGSTDYPNTAAPANIAAMKDPVASGTAVDFSLADYIGEFPNTLTQPGYANLYELRLYTSGPGQAQSLTYFRVDIAVTVLSDVGGVVTGLWDVVFPATASSSGSPSGGSTGTPTATPTVTGSASGRPGGQVTATTLSATPASPVAPGTTITLTIVVTPAGIAGEVQVFDGTRALGSAEYTAATGTGTLIIDPISGQHSFTANFTPSDTTAADGSGSDSLPYTVTSPTTGPTNPVTVTTPPAVSTPPPANPPPANPPPANPPPANPAPGNPPQVNPAPGNPAASNLAATSTATANSTATGQSGAVSTTVPIASDSGFGSPPAVGGSLTLASRSTSMAAFVGLWLALAAAVIAVLLQIMRRDRAGDGGFRDGVPPSEGP